MVVKNWSLHSREKMEIGSVMSRKGLLKMKCANGGIEVVSSK